MNKFLELLEQHIQWIAIGLGGLFFLWVVWGYVITPPVTQVVPSIGSVTPGTVDAEVEKDAKKLEGKIKDATVRTPKQAAKTNPLEGFVRDMQGLTPPPATIAQGSFSGIPLDVKGPIDPGVIPELHVVKVLPAVPPAYMMPGAGIKPARVLAIVGPVGVGQPNQPQAPAGAALAVPANAKDVNYIRGEYKIDPADIDAEFAKVEIPNGQQTMILEVQVWRQEMQTDGSWTKPTQVNALDNGIKRWPVPSKDAGFQALGQFEAWFGSPQGQADLLRPPFYQVLVGEGPWDAPQTLDDAKAAVNTLNAADRAARDAENKARLDQRRQNQPPAQPEFNPGERPRVRRGGNNEFQVQDPTRPNRLAELAGLELAQIDPRRQAAIDEEAGMGGAPDGQPWQQPGQPAQPGVGQPNMPALPQAVFLPKGTPPIFGWFFDTDVKEGRTYRYQVRYAIKNPMWQNNQVADLKLANQFALWSELAEKAWSEARTIETSTQFFIADRSWQPTSVPNSVRIEVYKWTAGKWQNRVFQVGIGDSIGWEEANVQFKTSSTLVDVRFDERNEKAFILVLGPDGHLHERDPLTDRQDPDRAALKLLVDQGKLPAGASTGQ